jgi:flagellar assembly protein FliH
VAQLIHAVQIDDEPVLLSYAIVKPEPAAPLAPEAAASAEPTAAVVQEEDPRATIDALRRQAFEDGYRDGREEGLRVAKAELAGELEALRTLAASMRGALEEGIGGQEDALVEIAFAAVCRILGEAAAREDGVRSMVREAARAARAKEGIVLRVSAGDQALLQASRGDELGVDVVADERVSAGGCLIETSGGTLDARLEVQLRQLLDALTRARETQGE